MSDDGDKDQGGREDGSSRPGGAADRRARRSGNGGDSATPRRKSPGAASASGQEPSVGTPGTIEEAQPLPKRIARYLREVLAELRKVVWPTRKQMSTYTLVVLAFMAFMIGLVWVLDIIFAEVMFTIFG